MITCATVICVVEQWQEAETVPARQHETDVPLIKAKGDSEIVVLNAEG